MNNVRVRFAPSPTGYLHIGSLRTVIFDYLIAKKYNGKLILRIEDTDQKRFVPGAVEKLIKVLDLMDLKFDEGPHVGGNYGPYTQTERLDIYKKYYEKLLNEGKAYRCFCSPERLEKMRNEQSAQKLPPRYDRTCRYLTPGEIDKKLKAGEGYVVRQAMPETGEVIAHDELRGDIKFKLSELDDQVLIKSDGIPTYQFAMVVDDHTMEITHVVRGEEWIPSFPKNIQLYQEFGWAPPKFIHMTLTLNKGGGKLSKRQGDVTVEDFINKGYLKEALINFSVLQGWHPRGDQEIFTLDEIIKEFSIEDMGTSPAVFDIEKLDYLNGYYIRQMDLDKLTKKCIPFLAETSSLTKGAGGIYIVNNKQYPYDYIKSVVKLEQERLKKLSDIKELTHFFFQDKLNYEPELLLWKKLSNTEVKANLEFVKKLLEGIAEENWNEENLNSKLFGYIKEKELKVGDYLWPMRVALTGEKASPGPFEVAAVIGKSTSMHRINQALNSI